MTMQALPFGEVLRVASVGRLFSSALLQARPLRLEGGDDLFRREHLAPIWLRASQVCATVLEPEGPS